jgi:hypothetical protein
MYPAGQTTGTISDFRKFAAALLADENGFSPLFKKAETLAELYTPTLMFPSGNAVQNAHGFWGDPLLAGNVIGHGGNTAGCSSYLIIDPIAGIGAAVMTNQVGETVYNNKMLRQIFGEKEYVSTGDYNTSALVGVYTLSRGVHKGTLSFLNSLSLFPIFENKDGTPMIPGTIVENAGAGIYKMTDENTGTTMMMFAKISADNQVTKLSSFLGHEFFRTSWAAIIFEIILLLILVLGGVYGFITLIVMFIRMIRKKPQPLGGYRAIVCLSLLATPINCVILIVNVSSMIAAPFSLTIHGLLFILLMLIPIVYKVILVRRMSALEMTKREKRQRKTTAIFGLLMTFSIICLQLWWFWA